MKTRLALTALTLLGVVACQPTPDNNSVGGYPTCDQTTSAETCVQIEQVTDGTGWGYIITPDGTTQSAINFWSDGSFEIH